LGRVETAEIAEENEPAEKNFQRQMSCNGTNFSLPARKISVFKPISGLGGSITSLAQ
jgi:hypothetical protein